MKIYFIFGFLALLSSSIFCMSKDGCVEFCLRQNETMDINKPVRYEDSNILFVVVESCVCKSNLKNDQDMDIEL